MPTCYIRLVLIRSSSLSISLWASWTHQSETFLLSQQRRRIGSGSNLQWRVFLRRSFFFLLIHALQVDEEESGDLRGLAEVLLNYGERHFEGAPGSKGARIDLWATVLLTCGEFERVSGPSHAPHTY